MREFSGEASTNLHYPQFEKNDEVEWSDDGKNDNDSDTMLIRTDTERTFALSFVVDLDGSVLTATSHHHGSIVVVVSPVCAAHLHRPTKI